MAYLDKPIQKVYYPSYAYNFRDTIRHHLNVYDLTRIHELCDNKLVTRKTDQANPFQKRFYEIGDDFYAIYHGFITDIVEKLVGEPVVFQKIPTFRIQMPDNLAVGEKHKDSDYAHSTDEINFLITLTPAQNTSTIWIKDKPIELQPGELLIFDGANLEHENKVNKEGYSRVSFDFRVIPKSKYKDTDRKSINSKMPMKIGGYWESLQ